MAIGVFNPWSTLSDTPVHFTASPPHFHCRSDVFGLIVAKCQQTAGVSTNFKVIIDDNKDNIN